jgi:hypothetical protein
MEGARLIFDYVELPKFELESYINNYEGKYRTAKK